MALKKKICWRYRKTVQIWTKGTTLDHRGKKSSNSSKISKKKLNLTCEGAKVRYYSVEYETPTCFTSRGFFGVLGRGIEGSKDKCRNRTFFSVLQLCLECLSTKQLSDEYIKIPLGGVLHTRQTLYFVKNEKKKKFFFWFF